jgi:hypothetical protein
MTEGGGTVPGPVPTPVEAQGRGPSTSVALGLFTAALVALVGISLVGQSGDRPGPQAAGDGPTGTPVATPAPTAPPTPAPGTPPPRVAVAVGPAPTCPPGSTPDTPGPVAQARPNGLSGMAGLGRMAFDRRAGRLVALAGDLTSPVETWTFDVCTNSWTRMHPNQEPPGGTYGLVYDVDSDLTIATGWSQKTVGERMWAYDLEANTWTEKEDGPPIDTGRRFYDPVSGLVVAMGDDGDDDTVGMKLWSYEVETDTWTPIPQADRLAVGPHYEFLAYDASVDRLVAYTRACPYCENIDNPSPPRWARTWLFDLRTGTWSGTSAVAQPDFNAGMWGHVPAIAYDEAAERIVILGQGHSAAYDATADRWETLYGGSISEDWWTACGIRPECRQLHFMVYDPVNERLLVYGGFLTGAEPEVELDDVLAFDTRTQEWTVLLEASQPVTPVVPPSPGE